VTAAATGGVLVIGYGNALRTDDGVGPAVAEPMTTRGSGAWTCARRTS